LCFFVNFFLSLFADAAASALVLLAACTPKPTPSLTGQWQGTLRLGEGSYRTILLIANEGSGSRITFYSLDEDNHATRTENVVFDGRSLSLTVPAIGASFKAALSTDGNSLVGSFTQRETQPLTLERASQRSAWSVENPLHRVQMVAVEAGVTLEVLDFGGTGRPLLFLPGLGRTAHDFDELAKHFTKTHHVLGVTRRGFGNSAAPEPGAANYSATRRGRDVLAVMAALKLERPVLAGHSYGGSELSAIANIAPDKVAGLIYLDAAYIYAFYAPGGATPMSLDISVHAMQVALENLDSAPLSREGLADLRRQMRDLKADIEAADIFMGRLEAVAPPRAPRPAGQTADGQPLEQRIGEALMTRQEKFTAIKDVPVLAIFATQTPPPPNSQPFETRMMEGAQTDIARLIDAFARGVPQARIVRIPGASHFVWRSHEAQVVKEMQAFMGNLNHGEKAIDNRTR
jgi:pimeloyl-ACP methyl ester carboxylesterase